MNIYLHKKKNNNCQKFHSGKRIHPADGNIRAAREYN